ncbi:hypothetical protein TVAG_031820 [Trichomonas vaginalis G3]|uniref:DUF3447 domain-containing protein n=1 Tax=Trichomonas vaginalis (strain ATCC PRA-98 / G3) TaxID=412133 RepID=A2EUI1_TRIV3|nr:ankyrin repeat and SOCS box-containing protein 4 family [Trichomonas vaginalis G3]EAY03683.1 hypothetical protein TVAG_031820 [Trichomonas vaginalis G3]KAI5532099.1 ankyrin repeat and SOCS box-containing protein 4 family [Trichomonas vaginalis G3]|eukprot:XP_001315906.1 hypothetical protein [Trichomonas vaginalis G3]
MSEQDVHPNDFSAQRSMYKYYIDSYNALYQLKTENEEELNKIYNMIKTELIDSKKYHPQNIVKDILNIIPFNNRYTKSYLTLAKFITDDYNVKEVTDISVISDFIFYKEYGIKLGEIIFVNINSENINIHTENTIYRAIMYNDLETFISFTESNGFDKDQKLKSMLYPLAYNEYSLLELCCYHGAIGCFKLLITKFKSEITKTCLQLSFLGRNQEIMSECLKYQKPDSFCMDYAIISHNIDFVTFLMNEYNIEINLDYCTKNNNLESFLVYFDQTNNFNLCFDYSKHFEIPSLCQYFLSLGANVNIKNYYGETALHYAALNNSKEIVEVLLSYGANINEKDESGETALHKAALHNSKEEAEVLLLHGANINEKDESGETALHIAAFKNNKEIVEVLLTHGANINEKNKNGKAALHNAALHNSKETVEVLLSYGANISGKDEDGETALHVAALHNSKEIVEVLLSYGANINEKDESGETALHKAALHNSKEEAEVLLLHGANINEKDEFGKTALHNAECQNNKGIVKLLLSHGAKI